MNDAKSSTATDLSLLGVANAILERRRLVVACAAVAAFVTAAVMLFLPRHYTSDAVLLPQGRRQQSALSGLAMQFGISLPAGEASQSPNFYAELLESRALLGEIARDSVRGSNGQLQSLAQVYHIRERADDRRREAVVRRLTRDIQATAIVKTGVVELRVTAPSQDLALSLSERLIERLNHFNLETRKSQASAERRFTEQRVASAADELRQAEDRLQQFLQQNRDYRGAPTLVFQYERLSRDVQLRQQVYSSLAQAYEQARIEEVRDTPVLTVVDKPERPARPDPRGLVARTLAALLGGGLVGVLLALLLRSSRLAEVEDPDEWAEYRRLRMEAVADFDGFIARWRKRA